MFPRFLMLLLAAVLLAACDSTTVCTPSCAASACGDDGCGGTCGPPCPAANTCADAQRDGTESDVDCGGSCGRCGDGRICSVDGDCESNTCTGGVCSRCRDTQSNGAETDVDCGGGVCPGCSDGRKCAGDGDCLSHACTAGVCKAASCTDGKLNQNETAIDCGGSCPKCADGKTCNLGADCVSGICWGGVCTNCANGKKDGSETDVDCGGGCQKCGDGKACKVADDCVSARCVGGVCQNCANGKKDGNETDVDCGGTCAPCPANGTCLAPTDCASGACTNGKCAAPASCQNSAKDGSETDVDCGGPDCAPCPNTKFCKVHADCLSLACIFGVCKDPTCVDGAKNQGEGDVDCGGPCTKKCANGKTCGAATDCSGGACEGGLCCSANACGACGALPQEICNGKDDDCNGIVDDAAKLGAPPACGKQQGVCANSRSECRGTTGWVCDDATYRAFNAKYQATETLCDGLDNDCDGQTDEGLLNACGRCGPTPKEICNGLDDDCNGKVDDHPLCASCPAAPAQVKLVETGSGYGFVQSFTNYLAMLGDSAYLLVSPTASSVHLYRLDDGALTSDLSPVVGNTGSTSIASEPGGTVLHVADVRYNLTSGGDENTYQQLDATGTTTKKVVVGAATNRVGAPVMVAVNKGVVGMVYAKYGSGFWYGKLDSAGTAFSDIAAVGTTDDQVQNGLDSAGKAHWAWTSGPASPVSVIAQSQGGSAETLSTNGGRPMLRVGPDDTVWVVYSEAGSVKLRRKSKGYSTFSPTVDTVAAGTEPGIAIDPTGTVYVSYSTGMDVYVATKVSGTWKSYKAMTTADASERFIATSVGVDSANRLHVGAFSQTGSPTIVHQRAWYAMTCAK